MIEKEGFLNTPLPSKLLTFWNLGISLFWLSTWLFGVKYADLGVDRCELVSHLLLKFVDIFNWFSNVVIPFYLNLIVGLKKSYICWLCALGYIAEFFLGDLGDPSKYGRPCLCSRLFLLSRNSPWLLLFTLWTFYFTSSKLSLRMNLS